MTGGANIDYNNSGINHIIFGTDGENWNWTLLGYIYLFVRQQTWQNFILMTMCSVLVIVHFFDNSPVGDKWIKRNVTYLYELALFVMAGIVISLLWNNAKDDRLGMFLLVLVTLSNVYRVIASLGARIIQGGLDDLIRQWFGGLIR